MFPAYAGVCHTVGVSDLALYKALTEFVAEEISKLRQDLMSAASQALQEVVSQLGKAKGEIVAELARLAQAIEDGTISDADLDGLRAAAQALDDVVPDTNPEPEPEPEPEA